jgi:hypothetical protein
VGYALVRPIIILTLILLLGVLLVSLWSIGMIETPTFGREQSPGSPLRSANCDAVSDARGTSETSISRAFA